MPNKFIEDPTLEGLRQRLIHHPLYASLISLDKIKIFMEHHVFAVWDFMSIVKSLQQSLTGISIPWIPPRDEQAARLINEIVLCEESDELLKEGFSSHYNLYLNAMHECGAKTETVEQFVKFLESGKSISMALNDATAPKPACDFVINTFALLENADTHVQAALLFYGRENLIPDMFHEILVQLNQSDQPCSRFIYYLDRHIQIDGEKHGVWAESLLLRLCKNKKDRKEDVKQVALQVLQSRLDFWDSILEEIKKSKSASSLV